LQLRDSLQPKFAHLHLVDEPAVCELVTLYVAKLIQLYLKVLVIHYDRTNARFDPTHLDSIITELDSMSRDLLVFR
jgi:hypothetical protein